MRNQSPGNSLPRVIEALALQALVEHYDVPKADHGYDVKDVETARQVYALIAHHVRQSA